MPIEEPIADRIRAYYLATTEASYLKSWSGEALALHLGFADEHTKSHDESLLNVNRYLAERACVTEGTRVLDAGCGVGGSSLWLAKERGAEVTGVTIAPNQVTLAERFAAERGLADRVSFFCMDVTATSFPEASFDVIWHVESYCHLTDQRAYLDHAMFLLRDGGRFACLDFFRGQRGDAEHARAMCEGWVLPALGSLDDLTTTLKDAGFSAVTGEDVTNKTLLSAAHLEHLARGRLRLIDLEKAMGLAGDPLYEGHARAAVAAALGLRDGAVVYGYAGGVRPPR